VDGLDVGQNNLHVKPPILQPYQTIRGNAFYKAIVDSYSRVNGTRPPDAEDAQVIAGAWLEFFGREYISKEEAITMRTDCQILMMLLRWHAGGRNCFVFTQELVEEFIAKDSNAEDIPVDVLKLPYDYFYLKFGKHSGIRAIAGRDRWVDGCYLEKTPNGVYVTYTQIADDESTGSTGAHFLFRLDSADTVGEALQSGLEFEEVHKDQERDIAEEVGGDAPRLYRDCQPDAEAVREQRNIVAPQVARLVANCLAYILFVPEDVEGTFIGAPEKLVAKLNRTTTDKDKKKNKSKLEANGFSYVKLVGRRMAEQLREALAAGGSVRPHWRRGHWRLQPVGTNLSQLRLTWVRPTIVRADKGDPEHGHTYRT
jgi:hypothetical protein